MIANLVKSFYMLLFGKYEIIDCIKTGNITYLNSLIDAFPQILDQQFNMQRRYNSYVQHDDRNTGQIQINLCHNTNANIDEYQLITEREGGTPLHIAVEYNNIEIVELLLENGASTESVDRNNMTPLHWAVDLGYKDIIKLLVKGGANINAQDINKSTPLHWACDKEDIILVELLADLGADVNCKDVLGNTPMHYAAMRGYVDTAETLVRLGVDVNARNLEDRTPLHSAIKLGEIKLFTRMQVMEILISNNADINAADKEGSTPLNLAAWGGCFDMVMLLVNKGAKIHILDNLDRSPHHIAEIESKRLQSTRWIKVLALFKTHAGYG